MTTPRLAVGRRRISERHAAKLRDLVAESSASTMALRLGSSPDTILDAITGGRFRPATAERLEREIDDYVALGRTA